MNVPKILVFAASTRADSLHRKLARTFAAAVGEAGAEVTFADLKDYPMPLYDGDIEAQGYPENARRFRELIQAHDGLAIASPEYNGSFPAVLKNVIDWVSRPLAGERPAQTFKGKPAAILSTSPGPSGGRRGLKHLRELLTMIGVSVLADELTIPKAFEAMDAGGELLREEDRARLAGIASELVRATGASSALQAA